MTFEDNDIYQAILDNDTEQLEVLLECHDINHRGYDGSSFLHVAIDHGANSDIVRLLLHKIDISFRDENGDTALDMAITREASQIQWLILDHIGSLVIEGNRTMMEYLLQQGWDAWPVDVHEVKEVGKDMQRFFRDLPIIRKKIYGVHHCIEEKSLEHLRNILTSQQLAVTRDHTGLPPLQKAVVFQQFSIAEYIIREFPTTVSVVDNMGRTALHYAACCPNENFFTILKKAGADNKIKDLTGTTPEIFRNNPGLFVLTDVQHHIETLQQTLPAGLQFRLSTLDIIQPDNDNKTITQSKHQTSSTSNLPATINIHRKKSVFNQSAASSGQANQSTDPTQGPVNKTDEEHGEPKLFEDAQLYEAVVMNDMVFVEHLLRNGHVTHLRSLEGWSYLHLAVMHSADEIILQQLINKVDVSVHDIDGNTAVDLLLSQSWKSKKMEIIQKAMLEWVARGDVAQLKRLAMNGWYLWPPLNVINSSYTILKTIKLFLMNVKYAQNTVDRLHELVTRDDLTELQDTILQYSKSESSNHVLGKDDIVKTCDKSGIPLFIKSVILNSKKCFNYLLDNYPQIAHSVDNMVRTALHYCTDVNNMMYKRLIESGVDQSCPDLWGMAATDYLKNPHVLCLDRMSLRLRDGSHDNHMDKYNQPWPLYLMNIINSENMI